LKDANEFEPMPVPPVPASEEGLPARLWRRFRALPTKAQVAAWVVLAFVAIGSLGEEPPREVTLAPVVSDDAAEAIEEVTGEPTEEPTEEATEEPSPEPTEEATEEATEEPTEEAAEEDATPAPASEEASATAPAGTWTVFHIVDGDTLDVRSSSGVEERIRVIGIDTPERGECGFDAAAQALSALVGGKTVELVPGARDDRDRYDRLLRYVDVDGVDAGLELIKQGLAIARYDSRDGYGRHPREAAYVAADAGKEHTCAAPPPPPAPAPAPGPAPAPQPAPAQGGGPGSGPGGAYKNCTEARERGGAPVRRGEPGYGSHLDRDNDGIGCE
jgi:endonuclease YncB( thermonuclease family)